MICVIELKVVYLRSNTRPPTLQLLMLGLLLCSDRSVPSHWIPGLRWFASLGFGFVKPSIFLEAQKSVHEHKWSGSLCCFGDERGQYISTEVAISKTYVWSRFLSKVKIKFSRKSVCSPGWRKSIQFRPYQFRALGVLTRGRRFFKTQPIQ